MVALMDVLSLFCAVQLASFDGPRMLGIQPAHSVNIHLSSSMFTVPLMAGNNHQTLSSCFVDICIAHVENNFVGNNFLFFVAVKVV